MKNSISKLLIVALAVTTNLFGASVVNAYMTTVDVFEVADMTMNPSPNHKPTANSANPNPGHSTYGEKVTIRTDVSDNDGNDDLYNVKLIVNWNPSGYNTFYAYYRTNDGRIYLRNDDNSDWAGTCMSGDDAVLENSFVKLDCSGTHGEPVNDAKYAVDWNVSFKPTMKAGLYRMFVKVMDKSKSDSGWVNLGNWTIKSIPEPVCGNGLIENGEECDDGNITGGDGCSPECDEEITINNISFNGSLDIATAYLSKTPTKDMRLESEIYKVGSDVALRGGSSLILAGEKQPVSSGFRSDFEMEGLDAYDVAFAVCPDGIYSPSPMREGCGPIYRTTVRMHIGKTCKQLLSEQRQYFDTCSESSYEYVCFSNDREFQGCTHPYNNDCTQGNVDAHTNIMCPIGDLGSPVLWNVQQGDFAHIKEGESTILVAKEYPSQNPILHGVKDDQLECIRDDNAWDSYNVVWVCTGISDGNNTNNEIYYTLNGEKSNSVIIQVDKATPAPPAGYEDEVRVKKPPVSDWFSDLDPNSQVGIAANYLADNGIIGGFPDGTFRAKQLVNRAEMSKFITNADETCSIIAGAMNNGRFSDLIEGEWYVPFVISAADCGIIYGNPDGTFAPERSINTVEFLAMLARANFGLETGLPYTYGDVPSGEWYSKYVGEAERRNFFPERGNMLEPGRYLTRGEVAYVFYLILSRNEQSDCQPIICKNGNSFPTCDKYGNPISYHSNPCVDINVNLPPSISGVSGPSVLKPGENGVWKIEALDPEKGPLSYSVIWGDENLPQYAVSMQKGEIAKQTVSFTHIYSQAGEFTPTFTVTDDKGLSAKTSISVDVRADIDDIALAIDINGPASQSYSPDANDIVLANLDFNVIGNDDINVKEMYALIHGKTSTGGTLACHGEFNNTMAENIEDIEVRNIVTGQTVSGTPVSFGTNSPGCRADSPSGFDSTAGVYRFDNFVLRGSSRWELRTDFVASVPKNGDRFRAYVCTADEDDVIGCNFGGNSVASTQYNFDAEELSTGDKVTDIRPGEDINGNWQIVSTSSLSITESSLGTSDTVVENAQDVAMFRFEATGTDDLFMNRIVLRADTGSLIDATDYTLWVDADGDGVVDNKLQYGVTTSNNKVVFDNLYGGGYALPKTQTIMFEVHADISGSLTNDELSIGFDDNAGTQAQWDFIGAEKFSDGMSLSCISVNGVVSSAPGCNPNTAQIFVNTAISKKFDLKSQGSLFVTKDSTPTRSRQLLAGELGKAILRLELLAVDEPIDVTRLVFTNIGTSTQNINRIKLYREGDSTSFASATKDGCNNISSNIPANSFCAIMESQQLVIPEDNKVDVLVRPQMKSDEEGAVNTENGMIQFAVLRPTDFAAPGASADAASLGTVTARGFISINTLVFNNGDGSRDGEIIVGRSEPGPDIEIIGSQNDTVLAKIVSIENVNPDPDGSQVPVGSNKTIAEFKFTAAANNNTLGGRNRATLSGIVFNVDSTNVAFNTSNFKLFNKATGSTNDINCMAYDQSGSYLVGVSSGSMLVKCNGIYNPSVDLTMDSGKSITLVLQAGIINNQINGSVGSFLQVSLTDFSTRRSADRSLFGVSPYGANSHIQWSDSAYDATTVLFDWIENDQSVIKSTLYQL